MLVGLELTARRPSASTPKDPSLETSAEDSLAELRTLAVSAGADIVATHLQYRPQAEAATLLGGGKVQEIATEAQALDADLVIIDNDLTPTQLRNLEKQLKLRVIDRTQLILDIFASRARTREGKLQVELAQLEYILPRLTGMGLAMSRLGGGIGTKGPGETKLEMDRRKIGRRIKRLADELEHVRATRGLQRRARQAVPLATIGLVGYTNAGKSTLFNRLTGAAVMADARMFATLDPTVRQVTLPSKRLVLLSDTVGFIRRLPTTLVKAFRATLEEVNEAVILLHVIDATAPDAAEQTSHVLEVLRDINAAGTPQIVVLNKCDLIANHTELDALTQRITAQLAASELGPPPVIVASGQAGINIDQIVATIDRLLTLDAPVDMVVTLPHDDGATLHLIHEQGASVHAAYKATAVTVTATVPASVYRRIKALYPKQTRHPRIATTTAKRQGRAGETIH